MSARVAFALKARTYMRLKTITGARNVLPIPALLPTAFHTIVAALLVEEEKLELEGVGVTGNFAKKGGAGGIREVECGVAEKLM
ncbi:bestrophin 4 [Babesia caballi]|uniref:Bestrophin 4 n=1 Tax=Babesia caballi TaxID=5871 RepID=A0AAV4M142_BABCB|nr:bestrophin 4 [Babesia caballi]